MCAPLLVPFLLPVPHELVQSFQMVHVHMTHSHLHLHMRLYLRRICYPCLTNSLTFSMLPRVLRARARPPGGGVTIYGLATISRLLKIIGLFCRI